MTKIVKYKRTWCEFLTPCEHKTDVEIGSYDCSKCEHFVKFIEEEKLLPGEYFKNITGTIECKHNK